MNKYFDIAPKTILITGASSGIGRETAVLLAQSGASLILTGRNQARLHEVLEGLENSSKHRIFQGDLTDESILDKLVSSVEGIDGVVLAAGIVKTLPIKFLNKVELSATMSINFEAPVLLCQKLIKAKKVNKGASIVFISSIAGNVIVNKGNGSYAASKAALNGICKVMALELAAQKIRVNCISPGMVWSPLIEDELLAISNEQLEADQKAYPLGYGTPVDVANAVWFLLSEGSKWITGTSLVLDGGFTLQ